VVTLKEAKDITDSIVEQLDPLSVVLFGSVARENTGEDLDLLIIVEDTPETMSNLNIRLNKSLRPFYRKFDIDPFIIQHSLFNEYQRKGSPFLKIISREGRSLYMKNAVQEWIKQSVEELGTAKYLLEGGYRKGACYHAQQAIEKAVKAQLLSKGWDIEKTHNMERLVAIGIDYKIRFSISEEETVFIDSIYRGRYPIETGLLPLGEPSTEDAEKAVSIAKRTVKTAKSILKKKA
jgi:HEPN domain-containing protein/predicted nucleotidyltransferase